MYLNIKIIVSDMSSEKNFTIATIVVPTMISNIKKRAPKKYLFPFSFSLMFKAHHHSHSRDVMPLNAQPSNSYFSLSTNFNLGSAANSFGKATKLIIVLAIDAPAQ